MWKEKKLAKEIQVNLRFFLKTIIYTHILFCKFLDKFFVSPIQRLYNVYLGKEENIKTIIDYFEERFEFIRYTMIYTIYSNLTT